MVRTLLIPLLGCVCSSSPSGITLCLLHRGVGFSTQPPTFLAAALEQCAQGQVFRFLIIPFLPVASYSSHLESKEQNFGESWGKYAEIGLRRLLLHIPMAAALGPASSSRVCPPLGGRGSAPVSGA